MLVINIESIEKMESPLYLACGLELETVTHYLIKLQAYAAQHRPLKMCFPGRTFVTDIDLLN